MKNTTTKTIVNTATSKLPKLLSSQELVAKHCPLAYQEAELLGGKAAALAALLRQGFPIPPFMVLSTEFFAQEARMTGEDDTAYFARATQNALCTPFRFEQERLLDELWKALTKKGCNSLAVRSSISGEDSKEHSFAGIFTSILGVNSRLALSEAVRTVNASRWSKELRIYCQEHTLDAEQLKTAVLVQVLLDPESSGIAFSRKDGCDIVSVQGLGEGLAAGTESGDSWQVDTAGHITTVERSTQKTTIRVGPDGQTQGQTLSEKMASRPSLNKQQIQQVQQTLHRVKSFLGCDCDIEFAFQRKQFWLLQARAVTAALNTSISSASASVSMPQFIWDNSNIVESYPGITQPLTFTFIREAYRSVYRQVCALLGVKQKTLEEHTSVFNNMLGIHAGRVYYNLLSWYRLLALLPLWEFTRPAMEQMMGVKHGLSTAAGKETKNRGRYLRSLPSIVRISGRILLVALRFPSDMRRFLKHFYTFREEFLAQDCQAMSDMEIISWRWRMEREILGNWKAPIVNDLRAMVCSRLLRKLLEKRFGDKAAGIQNELLTDQGGVKSAGITTELERIAQIILQEPSLTENFPNFCSSQALATLNDAAAFPEVALAWKNYLKDYGSRSLDELKLESQSLRENPSLLVDILQSICRQRSKQSTASHTGTSSAAAPQPELTQESDASRLYRAIRRQQMGTRLLAWALHQTKGAIRDRETQRFCRAEAWDMLRMLYRRLGRSWEEKGLLSHREDIFYLEWQETERVITGAMPTCDLKSLVQLRKSMYAAYPEQDPPERFETPECPAACALPVRGKHYESGPLVKGVACSGGIVRGRVRKLTRPESSQELEGAVVVARQTDPGWIVLYPLIAALVVEKGSILSHSAIVARELGLPAIVGASGAWDKLEDGMLVELNGAAGTLEILDEAQ